MIARIILSMIVFGIVGWIAFKDWKKALLSAVFGLYYLLFAIPYYYSGKKDEGLIIGACLVVAYTFFNLMVLYTARLDFISIYPLEIVRLEVLKII